MPSHGRTVIFGLSILLTGALGVAGYQAHALQQATRLEPAVIATVDFLRVVDSVEEKAEAIKTLEAELAALIDEREARRQLIAKLEADMDDFQPGTPQYTQAQQKWSYESLRFHGWSQFANLKMDSLNADAMEALYLSIKEHASVLAERNGYDLVLVDDELVQFVPGSEAEILRQIAARRMLFSNDVIDITDDLIALMNAANPDAQPDGQNVGN